MFDLNIRSFYVKMEALLIKKNKIDTEGEISVTVQLMENEEFHAKKIKPSKNYLFTKACLVHMALI